MAAECMALNYLTVKSSIPGSGECSFLKKKKKSVYLAALGLSCGPWNLRWLVWDLLLQPLDSVFSARTPYLWFVDFVAL